MTVAFVLGNGVSRRGIDLTRLQSHGKIYGCNALYREFTPDVLVATDGPISSAIIDSGYANSNKLYTRAKNTKGIAMALCAQYQGYSSGPNAVALAAIDRSTKIYLIGFDMGPTDSGLFNNLYASTEFYKTREHPPTFTGNWVKQIVQIIKDFPQTQFIRVIGTTTADVLEFRSLANFKSESLDQFMVRINNQKDF